MSDKLVILDNHMHLRLDGRHVEAVKEFLKFGGTHIVLSHMPYRDIPTAVEKDFQAGFERTLSLAEKVRRETDARIYATLGPYPVELIWLAKKMDLEAAKGIMLKGMELAGEYVKEGKAVAIGEMGRPHFPVPEEIWEASNDIMRYGMQVAKDAGCPVVLHTESTTPETCRELAEMADSVGLKREKVVKHYSPPLVDEKDNHGLFPSVLAGKSALESALSQGTRFFMETDYLDDLKRPGAVMGPATVPKRTRYYMEKGLLSEEDVFKIHVENPKRVYGLEME